MAASRAVSGTITMSTGAASQLVITTPPSSTEVSGAALVQQPAVTLEDSGGNIITSASGTATAAIFSGTGGNITAGSVSGTFSNGVATFSGLTLTGTAGTVYTLKFTGGGFTSAASTGITMSAGAATQLAITTEPSTSESSGTALAQQPVVKVEDAQGNVVTTATGTVSAAIISGSGGTITAGGTSGTFFNGVATFSGLTLTGTAGTVYTLQFTGGGFTSAASTGITMSAGAPNKLVITTPPSSTDNSGAALAQQPVVKVEDSVGNVVTTASGTVTAAITSGGVSVSNPTATVSSGVATFSGLALNALPGNYTLTFSDPGVTSAVSGTITVSAGAASQLVITTPPSSTEASGAALAQQPAVTLEDSGGNIITSASGTATAAITSGGVSVTNPTATISSGVATFSGLALNALVGTYTLHVFEPVERGQRFDRGLSRRGKQALRPHTLLGGTLTAGSAFGVQPVIYVEDSGGNIVTTDTSSVTLAIASGTAGAQLTCTANPKAASAGVTTFVGCSIDRPGTYTLTATDGSLVSATTSSFTVNPGTAVSGQGTMTVSPTSTTAGSTGNTLTFTFTAPVGSNFPSNSYVTIVIPSGWTAPSTTAGNAGYTTATAGSCTPGSVSVSGSTITVTQACAAGTSFTINYGTGTNATHVTAQGTAGLATFTAGSHAGFGGTATTLAAGSPQVTVILATTATMLASSSNPAAVNTAVTYTATVTFTPGGAAVTAGTVAFTDNSSTITGCGAVALNGSGVATCAFTYASTGTHQIVATYAGTGGNATSTSSTLTQTVGAATATHDNLLAEPLDHEPSGRLHRHRHLWRGGRERPGDGGLHGQRGIDWLRRGRAERIRGRYVSCSGEHVCDGHADHRLYVLGHDVRHPLRDVFRHPVSGGECHHHRGHLGPKHHGRRPARDLHGEAHSPATAQTPMTGSITFFDAGLAITGCTSVNVDIHGQATCTPATYTSAGSHTITAQYSGSTTYTGSAVSLPITQVVNAAGTSTVVVSTTGSPSVIDQSVTYTATVSVSGPGSGTVTSGTVEFLDNGTAASCGSGGVVNVVSGSATCTIPINTYTSVGSHTITAQYLGSANYAASAVSSAITQVVDNATTTAVVSSANPSVVGQTLVYTASVTSPTASAPTAGTVTFRDGSTAICTGVTVNLLGQATCTITAGTYSSVSTHSITATYNGTTNYIASAASTALSAECDRR